MPTLGLQALPPVWIATVLKISSHLFRLRRLRRRRGWGVCETCNGHGRIYGRRQAKSEPCPECPKIPGAPATLNTIMRLGNVSRPIAELILSYLPCNHCKSCKGTGELVNEKVWRPFVEVVSLLTQV